jgi:hypothetical protein
VGLGIAVLAAAIGTGGAAVWARAEQHPRVHAAAVTIHPQGDTNFCLESEGDGRIIVSQCEVRLNQHFTFTDNADGANLLVDSFGECLDIGNGRTSTPVTARQCSFGPTQEFVFTSTDKIKSTNGTTCVAVGAATQDASVFDEGCHRASAAAQELFTLAQ